MIPLLQKRWPPAAEVRIDGETVAVAVKVSTRASSYRLSLPHGGAPLLTVPKFGRWAEAKAFLDRHTPWLAERLEALGQAGGLRARRDRAAARRQPPHRADRPGARRRRSRRA